MPRTISFQLILFLDHLNYLKREILGECIPVGCVLSATVAIWGGGVCLGGFLPRGVCLGGGSAQGVSSQGGVPARG